MQLDYGMLCEGTSDLRTLSVITERLAQEFGHELTLKQEVSVPAFGSVPKIAVKVRTRMFIKEGVALAVYFEDADKYNANRKRLDIKEAIEEVNEEWVSRSAIGVPEPHMEEWLLADQDKVKNFFGLDGASSLNFRNHQPKQRVNSLVTEYGEVELTTGEFLSNMAEITDLSKVESRCSSFAKFKASLKKALNYIGTLS